MAEEYGRWCPPGAAVARVAQACGWGVEHARKIVVSAIRDGKAGIRPASSADRAEWCDTRLADLEVDFKRGVAAVRLPTFRLVWTPPGSAPNSPPPVPEPERPLAEGHIALTGGVRVEIDLVAMLEEAKLVRTAMVETRNAGGRRPDHDWQSMPLEVGRYVYQHGMPEPRARLIHHLEKWFITKAGRAPDQRDIERRVQPILDAINRPIEGDED